jgi:hypothetical protein
MEAGINFYTNKNELTKLASAKRENNNSVCGHPINVIYDYKKIGLGKRMIRICYIPEGGRWRSR